MSSGFSFHKYNQIKFLKQISLSIRQTVVCFRQYFLSGNRGISRYICQKASLTVEAAAVLPFYVCFMVFILYFFRIMQVQAGVAQSLQYAGRRAAAECCTEDHVTEKKQEAEQTETQKKGGTYVNLLKAKFYFQQELKKQNCPTKFIRGGVSGICFAQSDCSGNYIELKAVYVMKLPVSLFGNIKYQIVQQEKCRKWTGYQPGQDTEQNDNWLYYTEYGTVYHAVRTCTHLDLSIQGTPYSRISDYRNKSGGKYHTCEKCGSSVSNQGMVYITDYGDRYHASLTCSGLKRSIYMIRRSKATEKRMCKKCGS